MAETKEIKMDEKVVVKSIAPWNTGFKRILTNGDVDIAPKGSIRLSREEVIAQSQNGNKLLNGTDGYGNHATLYCEDEFVRKELEFDNDSHKQTFITADSIKKIFELKTMTSFKKNIEDNIVTRAEKVFLIECIKDLKLNDYEKIMFVQEYTGNKL